MQDQLINAKTEQIHQKQVLIRNCIFLIINNLKEDESA